MNLICSPTRSP